MMKGQGQGGAGGAMPTQEQLKNPSLSMFLDNPEMLDAAITMMQTNPQMIEGMLGSGVSVGTVTSLMKCIKSVLKVVKVLRDFFNNSLVRLAFVGLFVYLLYQYFN